MLFNFATPCFFFGGVLREDFFEEAFFVVFFVGSVSPPSPQQEPTMEDPTTPHRREKQGFLSAEAVVVKEPEKKSIPEKHNTIFYGLCVFAMYFTAGPSTIFLNAYVLHSVHFPYAACLSLLGVSTSTFVSIALILSGVVPSKAFWTHIGNPWFLFTRVGPIGVALAGTLAAGNAAYLHLSVAFIQILKAFSPVIVVSLLCLFKLEKPRSLLMFAVGVIIGGTVAATRGELHVTAVGLALMLLSELCEAIKIINIQLLLDKDKFDAWESMAFYGPAACVSLLTVALLTEDVPAAVGVISTHPHLFFIVSCSGLMVNLSTTLFIQATSALSLRITSLGRNVVIVLISSLFFRESVVTPLEFIGYLVCLAGCLIYTHARNHQDATIDSFVVAPAKRRCKRLCGGGSADSTMDDSSSEKETLPR